MLKVLKPVLVVFCVVAVLWFGYAFFDRQFKISNVKGEWPVASSTPITEKQQALLKEVFSEQFHYLDRGKQSFVFVSQDERYILKFFDARCLRSGDHPFIFSIEEEHCAKKLKQLFEGYHVGLTEDPENSGLLFLQLAPDPSYTFKVVVADRFSVKHEVDLAEVPFVLQKKAIPLRELMTTLLNKGKVNEAEKRLDQLVDMYVAGYKKGILDLDHNFMYNTGFVGDHPIRIDLGRLQLNEDIKDPQVYRKDLEKVMITRLGDWLEKYFPKNRKEILENMEKKIQSVTDFDQH